VGRSQEIEVVASFERLHGDLTMSLVKEESLPHDLAFE